MEVDSQEKNGAWLKKVRGALGLSQEGLARLIGYSTASVRNYERGYGLPPAVVIERVLAIERGRSRETGIKNSPKKSEKNQRWHALLDYVLDSGVPVPIEAVMRNLEALALTVQVMKGESNELLGGDAAAIIPEDIASGIAEPGGLAQQPEGGEKVL